MSKEILEGEVVGQEKKPQREVRVEFGKPVNFPGWKLLASLIPVFGLIFAIAWFYYEKNQKSTSIIYAAVGVLTGIFSTSTYLVLKFIIKAIF